MSDLKNLAFGKIAETMTPSGRVFAIREQNGNDDDVLSNPVTKKDLSNYDNFLAGIILYEKVGGEEKSVSINDIKKLLLQDRSHLLIFSRIHTMGPEMKFDFDFGEAKPSEGGGKFPYTEDLSQFLHDYTKEFPKEGEEGYFKYKIPPYPANAYNDFIIKLSTGKQLKFHLWNRESELLNLGLLDHERTKNSELKARGLSLLNEKGDYVLVENFQMFTKSEMIEIHNKVSELDTTQMLQISEITHPHTGHIVEFPVLASVDFFFPQEV